MSLPPPNIARQDETDEAAWLAQEKALRGEPPQAVAAAGILRFFAVIPAIGAWGLMLAWAFGELLSDRFWWSQFLDWLPLVLVIPGAALPLLFAEGCRRLMRRAMASERTLPRLTKFIAGGWLLLALLFVYFLQVELGATRAVGLHPHAPSGTKPARVLYWNSGGKDVESWSASIAELKPDVCVFNSIYNNGRLPGLAEAMSPDPVKSPTWTFRQDRFTLLSRAPIRRGGFMQLHISRGGGLDPRQRINGGQHYYDPGRAMFVEIDPSLIPGAPADRPIVLWVIDLPSDTSIPRTIVTQQAMQAIAGFRGPVTTMDATQRWGTQEDPQMQGFPAPDIIVGDFNIPRGSYSLGAITEVRDPAMKNAWNEAGCGYSATYPRRRPFWHLDQIFISRGISACDFGTLNAESGTHRAVWTDLFAPPAK